MDDFTRQAAETEKLPAPRDEGEREKMLAAAEWGINRAWAVRSGKKSRPWLGTQAEADRAIPPVSPPAGGAMPELVPGALGTPERVKYAALALYLAGRWTSEDQHPTVQAQLWANLRDALGVPAGTARSRGVGTPLAVVEVVEPEPEAAPSGWRYEVSPDGIIRIADARGRLLSTTNSLHNVPPIDREYVAALLERGR